MHEHVDGASSSSVAQELLDPDPFTIGLGIFAAIAGGGSFLETRRQRQLLERQQRDAFRAAWFEARRTLIFFKRAVDEFETYVLEDGYGRRAFRIGAVRLTVDASRHHALRRLRRQALTTANVVSDAMDELSNFLGVEENRTVQAILVRLADVTMPDHYRDLIGIARDALQMYNSLLDEIGEREGFESNDA